jgi:hypothetical protein
MNKSFISTKIVLLILLFTAFACNNDDNGVVVVPNIEINLTDLTVAIDENPTDGQVVGTVQTDSDEASNFSITSQTPSGALSIDSNTGEVTVANATLFDFETNPAITATITAADAVNIAAITINVTDLFESTMPGNSNTEFVIGTDAYITPKAYLLVDDANGDYERSFSFVFTDGDIVEDATDQISFETTTTVFTKITCNLIATKPTLAETSFFIWDPQSNPNGFLSIIMDGHNTSQYGIANFTNTYAVVNQTFGQPNDGTIHNHTALPDGDSANGNLFTINARTFDLNTMTGTIDCSYTYVDDNNVTVTGVFVGNYEILTAF